jgi:hypothetical protein
MSRSRDTVKDSSGNKSYTPSESNQLKATLTELLNTELAHSNKAIRAWAQARLMHVERQNRKERCLHGDTETAASIATHIVSDCYPYNIEPGGSKIS